ncbi:hypothetical protein BGZ65_011632 [Modicella reniformis]|uniref:Uncharacterized protein n=1 Tax=Modicella reniformis TaxID=1440133 RepID=A0A9P6MAP0_9FUNG|nr:hypothetical protein BGZ65_011632 [Modicella reniformis]
MSESPRKTPFSAQVLDDLDLHNRGAQQELKSRPKEPTVPIQPPTFDSFPDILVPKLPTSSALATDAAPPTWSIPSFSSFPIDNLPSHQSIPPSDLADVTIHETSKESSYLKHQEKTKSKKKERTHDLDDKERSRNKTRSTANRHDAGGYDGRERRKERKRSRSRSKDRSSQSHRDDRGERARHRSKSKDRSKVESSRDRRYSDRSNHDRTGRQRDRDGSRDRSHKKASIHSHSSRHALGRSRDDSKGPDRKKSRHDEFKEEEKESWSTRRERDLGREADKTSLPSVRSSHWSSKAEEKNKPGTWIIDVKGDQDVFRYGGLDPLLTPKFRRAGGGRVLGLPKHMRQDSGAGHEYKRITRAKAVELARSAGVAPQNPSYISLDIRSGGNQKPHVDRDHDKGSGNSDSDDGMYNGRKGVDYRDIHGKSVHKDEDEDLLQTMSDQEEEGAESLLDVLMRRRMILDNELRRDPKQPEKWLEFIAVEDEIDLVTNKRGASSVAHSASQAEVKMSIFERALQSNSTNEHLLLEYMNTCRQCWEPAKVLSKWDELLQSAKIQTAWPGLWITYLDFRQRHFLSFSIKSFTRVLKDALDRLGKMARSTWQDMQKTTEKADLQAQLVKIESVIVHVIARSWTFLKQAGYIERAQGIIQGQVEFLFNMPSSLTSEPWEIQIGSLEEYWDSELPRFGEKDAKGWTHYVTEEDEVAMENQLDQTKLPSRDAVDETLLKAFADNDMERYQYSRWATLEKELDMICWFPVRTTEDLPDQLGDDPYGIIIFDDIRPFIVPLYTEGARLLYMDCVFNFLGLAVNSYAGSNGHQVSAAAVVPTRKPDKATSLYNPYFHDSLLLTLGMDLRSMQNSNVNLQRFFPQFENKDKSIERVVKEIQRERQFREPEERDWSCVWSLPLHLYPRGADTTFGGLTSGSSTEQENQFPWASLSSHEEIQTSNRPFIRNIMQQLTEVVPLPKDYRRGISLYHLMYEALDTLSASKSQRLAKKYLKNDKMDLELWNGYALTEKAFGRISEARKVYSTVLSMYKSFPAQNQARAPLIYRCFAELEWEQGRPGVALSILVAYAEGVTSNIPEDGQRDFPMPTPTRLIKARQFYSQKVAQLNLVRPSESTAQSGATGGKWFEPALDLIACFSWFEYLSLFPSGTGLESGIKVFETTIDELDFRNSDCEMEVPVDAPVGHKVQRQSLLFSTVAATADLEAEKRTRKKKLCTGPEAEMAWIQLAKLVYFHSMQVSTSSTRSKAERVAVDISGGGTGFQPRDLRRIVRAGLARFPNCSILQSLFFWVEAKQRLHGRVRTWVHEQLMDSHGTKRLGGGGPLASKAPMWIFGLFYELWHQEPYNPHLVRSLLESVLESSKQSSFSSSPTLWLIYIEFEIRESARQQESLSRSLSLRSKKSKGTGKDKDKDKKSSRADLGVESSVRVKQLLMRALNDCPWCKDLYVLAFEPRMRDLFSIEELDQLYQTMLEKEIRVRYEIPEREQQSLSFAGGDKDMTENNSSGGESE